ncbi:glycosyl hydrolase 115 family protein [Thermoflavifilum thermophilum]|uniref:glycosyl hydrolase 115 family protein n=1 Tax=Thermoflavifilum thermophilum TaxID=1393122 RepID=UPI0015A51C23|nr:glycosyl hydrolase 115 family protein [Thermoflavifilum thermophilum]
MKEKYTWEQANVIIGTANDSLIKYLSTQYHLPDIRNHWEHFVVKILHHPFGNNKDVLLIMGSDPRGTAYGVFTVSRLIGVSPWKWWADAIPMHKDQIELDKDIYLNEEPSVKYRGIFINDEDWGFRPWAAKNIDTELNNIGPATYAKVFELLLRLRANTIWPAMHPGTQAFFSVPGNYEMAQRYDILIGTSHAEPMLRNNVGEWDSKQIGDYNYVTNRNAVYHYWEERVKQVSGTHNVIFTLGMRGIHDSKMEGAKTIEEQKQVLTHVFEDQRALLRKYMDTNLSNIPQIFIPYKEVLPVYDHGLKVPDDVTLVWPDDNYGYIRRLSNLNEQKRSGSSGVYYHISYWGKPHDYLWLCTTQPGLIWEEMQKAWAYGAHRIWILNVGDIKPGEFDMQFFLDMAWNIHAIKASEIRSYMRNWYAHLFGNQFADSICTIMDEYDRLASIRKPEFMGWNQVEPNTPVQNAAFHPFQHGDEIDQRIRAYQKLAEQAERIQKHIPNNLQDAYMELVLYPVKASAYMNEKILYAQKSRLFAHYHLPVAWKYASLSQQAYDRIVSITQQYNQVAHGKWRYMMDMQPRNLPVFQKPVLPKIINPTQKGTLIWLEGQSKPIENHFYDTLPVFAGLPHESHFIDLFNRDTVPVRWEASASTDWISIQPASSGILKEEIRLQVSVNPKLRPSSPASGMIRIRSGDSTYVIHVQLVPVPTAALSSPLLVEKNQLISLQAYQFTHKHEAVNVGKWTGIPLLGYSDSAFTLLPSSSSPINQNDTAYLSYRFYTWSTGPAEITIFTLPTHAVQPHGQLRIAVSVDQKPNHILSYDAEAETSAWKENVLSNHARCIFSADFTQPGWHELKIAPLDPGVVLDQILINFRPDIPVYAIQDK